MRGPASPARSFKEGPPNVRGRRPTLPLNLPTHQIWLRSGCGRPELLRIGATWAPNWRTTTAAATAAAATALPCLARNPTVSNATACAGCDRCRGGPRTRKEAGAASVVHLEHPIGFCLVGRGDEPIGGAGSGPHRHLLAGLFEVAFRVASAATGVAMRRDRSGPATARQSDGSAPSWPEPRQGRPARSSLPRHPELAAP